MEPLAPLGEQDDEEDHIEPDYLIGLSVRHRAFVDEYIKNKGKGTKAAIAAGYSPNSARGQASRLLTNANILAAINGILAAKTLTTTQILYKLSEKAEASIEPFVQSVGRTLMLDFSTKKAKAALHTIKKFKSGRYGPEIEFHDPIRAMVALEQIRSRLIKPGDNSNDPQDDVSQLTDDELDKQIQEIQRRIA